MGALFHAASGRRIVLSGRSLAGRSPSCLLHLPDPRVSGEHLVLRYAEGAWVLRDLGSRNGTLVNERRVAPGEEVRLQQGDAVVIGSAAQRWVLEDVSAPVAFAQPEGGGAPVFAVDGFLSLPDEAAPVLYAYEVSGGGWVVEGQGEVRDGARLEVDGLGWVLHLPDGLGRTWSPGGQSPRLVECGLRFGVSLDEEFVRIELLTPQGVKRLPSRAHDYLLLTLARARRSDAEQGLPTAEQGWLYVDELCRMVAVDENALGVQVYRARKALGSAGVQGAAELIERRRSTRQIRMGLGRVEVVGLEGEER